MCINVALIYFFIFSTSQSPEKTTLAGLTSLTNQYSKTNAGNTFIPPPNFSPFQDNNLYNITGQTHQNQNGFNFSNVPNGFSNTNGFVNFSDNDANTFGIECLGDISQEEVTPEHLNLLRLAAQEIGGAQFTSPNSNDKFFNFFEPSQRNSLPEPNLYSVGNEYNRPNSLNLDPLSFNTNSVLENGQYNNPNNSLQRYQNHYNDSSVTNDGQSDFITYLNQIGLPDQGTMRDNNMVANGMPDYNKIQMDVNHSVNYQNGEDFKMNEEHNRNKMYQNFNPNYQQMPGVNVKPYNGVDNNFYLNEMMKQVGNQSFDFTNTPSNVPATNPVNFKPNGFHQHLEGFGPRRDMNNQLMLPREGFQNNPHMNEQRFDNVQQANMIRQQELVRQMSLLMRNRQHPNQLNVDVNFVHENPQFPLSKYLFL